MKKKNSFLILFSIVFFSFANNLHSQTVIEMMHPGDANLVLLEVKDSSQADIVIYKTDNGNEANEWDCMWRFKRWGFSNFSVYITKDPNDSLLTDNDMGITYSFHGKVFFTKDKEERGYKTPGFQLEGVFRKTKVNDSEASRKSKSDARKRADEEDGE